MYFKSKEDPILTVVPKPNHTTEHKEHSIATRF